jgi:hypothetical protein
VIPCWALDSLWGSARCGSLRLPVPQPTSRIFSPSPTLRKIKGKVGHDGVERISTADVFDQLQVPMRARPGLTVRLSSVMRQLGWSNIRARGLNPGSYRDRVRGYAREVPGHPATLRLPNEF